MSNVLSPFQSHPAIEHATRNGQVQLNLSTHLLARVTQLSTWASGIDALESALGNALSIKPPALTGQTMHCPQGLVIRSGPLEFLLIASQAKPSSKDVISELRSHVTPEVGSVLDLSHARVKVHVEGPKAVEALGKLYALDFRDAEFPIDAMRLTGHHHIPCMMHRLSEQSFDLYMFTTYAHGQLELLIDAGREFGVRLIASPNLA